MTSVSEVASDASAGPYTPPRFSIDLSQPPKDRYRDLARQYKHDVQDLTALFDLMLRDFAVSDRWIPTVHSLSRLLLRKVQDRSQTEELQGVSEEIGMPMYLLVAFNVVLDLLVGCTSGGIRTLARGRPFAESKMLHFRTLDWSMDPLRRIVVQLEFVRSKSATPARVLATSITYVGFTGVLTGVRPGLSMTLNFRALHSWGNSTKAARFRFYVHHLLVLLGQRPSIAAYLRRYLIGDHEAQETCLRSGGMSRRDITRIARTVPPTQLADIYTDIQSYHTTAAYLIFSNGDVTMSIDKDFRTDKLRLSSMFIATTNHDVLEHGDRQKDSMFGVQGVQQTSRHAAGLEELLDESVDRLKCITNRWERLITKKQKVRARSGENTTREDTAARTALSRKQVIDWVSKYPTTNECTHFATVMDPKDNSIQWCKAYPEPRDIEQQLRLKP